MWFTLKMVEDFRVQRLKQSDQRRETGMHDKWMAEARKRPSSMCEILFCLNWRRNRKMAK